jgi:Ca2+-binding RTX toxin-like protein
MAIIEGTNGDDALDGNAQGQDDQIFGGRGNDTLVGLSGDDYLSGGRGADLLVGGRGEDVLAGGLDADVFQFSAGHIDDGGLDWIVDFSFNQADTLNFLDSAGGQGIEITSVTKAFVQNTSASGYAFSNNVATGTDLILEVRNTATNATQKIVLIDSYSASLSAQWGTYLASLGYTGAINDGGTVIL